MAPRFVIAGTTRSGSGYIARILTLSGINCGAESWWNPYGKRDDSIVGDSSGCALAAGLDDYDGLIWYQVRHPLDVILSMMRTPVLDPHLSMFARLVPDADLSDMLDFGMHWWLACARAAEKYDPRWWRVDQVDVDLVVELGDRLDLIVDPVQAAEALDEVPRTFNCHYLDRGERLSWDDLDYHDPVLAADIRDYADGYGFS